VLDKNSDPPSVSFSTSLSLSLSLLLSPSLGLGLSPSLSFSLLVSLKCLFLLSFLLSSPSLPHLSSDILPLSDLSSSSSSLTLSHLPTHSSSSSASSSSSSASTADPHPGPVREGELSEAASNRTRPPPFRPTSTRRPKTAAQLHEPHTTASRHPHKGSRASQPAYMSVVVPKNPGILPKWQHSPPKSALPGPPRGDSWPPFGPPRRKFSRLMWNFSYKSGTGRTF